MNKHEERLTGADTGFCSACIGLGNTHNDWCEQEAASVKPSASHASLIDDDEVERLEREGKS